MIRYLSALAIAALLTASAWGQAPFLLRNDPKGGAVTVDRLSATAPQSPSGTSYNFTGQTITAGLINPALVVFVCQCTGIAVTGLTLTWDSGGTNQALTQLGTLGFGGNQGYIFGLLNPVAGNKTLALSWAGTSQLIVGSFSVSHAAAFRNANTASGTSTTAAVTVVSQANDLVSSVFATSQFFTGVFSGTQIYVQSGGATWNASASYDPGSASVTATSGINVSGSWLAVGVDIVHD